MGPEILTNGYHDLQNVLHNDQSKPWVVQKFGGTSVGKFPGEIADKIVRYTVRSLSCGYTGDDFNIGRVSASLVWPLSALLGVMIPRLRALRTGLLTRLSSWYQVWS